MTPSERLWLWRLRQVSPTGRCVGRAGTWWSQSEAAEHLGLSLDDYTRLENGAAGEGDLPQPALELVPNERERCLLARRRSGLTVSQICATLGGITRPTFYRLERLADPRLLRFWGMDI